MENFENKKKFNLFIEKDKKNGCKKIGANFISQKF